MLPQDVVQYPGGVHDVDRSPEIVFEHLRELGLVKLCTQPYEPYKIKSNLTALYLSAISDSERGPSLRLSIGCKDRDSDVIYAVLTHLIESHQMLCWIHPPSFPRPNFRITEIALFRYVR